MTYVINSVVDNNQTYFVNDTDKILIISLRQFGEWPLYCSAAVAIHDPILG
jgi:hypothetical protein